MWKTRVFLLSSLILSPGFSAWAESTPRAKTVVVCDDVADPATLDPHKQFSEKNHTVVQRVYR
jgi:ABC-type oligopeptide transport system substrate-binding subunit